MLGERLARLADERTIERLQGALASLESAAAGVDRGVAELPATLAALRAPVDAQAPRAGLPLVGASAAWVRADRVRLTQVLLNVRLAPGSDWRSNAHLARETESVQAELGALGRVLIRASGTEPVLRVMVEARDAAQASRCAERLAEAVRAA